MKIWCQCKYLVTCSRRTPVFRIRCLVLLLQHVWGYLRRVYSLYLIHWFMIAQRYLTRFMPGHEDFLVKIVTWTLFVLKPNSLFRLEHLVSAEYYNSYFVPSVITYIWCQLTQWSWAKQLRLMSYFRHLSQFMNTFIPSPYQTTFPPPAEAFVALLCVYTL